MAHTVGARAWHKSPKPNENEAKIIINKNVISRVVNRKLKFNHVLNNFLYFEIKE